MLNFFYQIRIAIRFKIPKNFVFLTKNFIFRAYLTKNWINSPNLLNITFKVGTREDITSQNKPLNIPFVHTTYKTLI
jgi:hypothetical protein